MMVMGVCRAASIYQTRNVGFLLSSITYLEGGLLREDVEYLFGFIRVFPGSLRDISFRTACGLSVPANK